MPNYDDMYSINPISVIDENSWDDRTAEVALLFKDVKPIYTPLIDWDYTAQKTGAETTWKFSMLPPDVNTESISLTTNYLSNALVPDSMRTKMVQARYADKVQLHESENIYQQWKMSGGRDWKPLLRGILGMSVVRKMELLARNAFLSGPQTHWTYAGSATSFGTIAATDLFDLEMVDAWNLRLGSTGSPVVPGDNSAAKLCIIPPGARYDLMRSLPSASANQTALWRDAATYTGIVRNEIGTFKGVRFQESNNDVFGLNDNVLYNCGAISKQYGVTAAIEQGDGAPDPETTAVDETFYVGQKNATHYIQLENFASGDYAVGDVVTIHVYRTSSYGVTNGVDPKASYNSVRRIVAVDDTNNRLTFDRPISFPYKSSFAATSVSGGAGTFYAFVTKARHIGFALILGSRGGVTASVARGLTFYEPQAVDDFRSLWRYVWDMVVGFNVSNPSLFEPHFFAVSIPKVGGIITP